MREENAFVALPQVILAHLIDNQLLVLDSKRIHEQRLHFHRIPIVAIRAVIAAVAESKMIRV